MENIKESDQVNNADEDENERREGWRDERMEGEQNGRGGKGG